MLGQFDGTARKEPQWEPLQEVQLGSKSRKGIIPQKNKEKCKP